MKTLLFNHTRDEETPSLNPQGMNTFESHKGWTTSPSNSSNTQSHKNPLAERYHSTQTRFFKVFP